MSLYQLSKLLYVLNRDDAAKAQFRVDPEGLALGFDLSEEESSAFLSHDIGLLYVLGINGQILMHFAPICGIAWSDYLQMMRDGVAHHGPVRAGIYAMTSAADERVAGV